MIVDCAVYTDGHREPGTCTIAEAAKVAAACDPHRFAWLGLHEPSWEEFEEVRDAFDLHELAVEDAVTAHQRPKLELYDDSLFVVLKPARYVDPVEVVELGEIHLFVGPGFVVAVRHGQATALRGVRQHIEARPDLLAMGPSAVLHAIVDRVVDDYYPVMDGLDNDVSEVEQQVFSDDRLDPTERIYKLKREVLDFHRATVSLVEPLTRLTRGEHQCIHPDIREYFRDAHDHLLRVVEQLAGYRDLLTSALDANLTQVSTRQNEDMRKISAWVAIAVVPTLVAGIYGMNFEHMPELTWPFGYPLILGVMATICGSMYVAFRRSGWL